VAWAGIADWNATDGMAARAARVPAIPLDATAANEMKTAWETWAAMAL